MTVSGVRSITSSLCQSLGRSATPLFIPVGFIILLLYSKVLLISSWRSLRLAAVASALPMAVISIVAIDYGRWLMLAVLNAWLVAVALRLKGVEPNRASRRDYAIAATLLAGLLAMKSPSIYFANRAVRAAGVQIWGEDGVKLRSLDECDPGWRTLVGLPAQPAIQ
jgi:hypothetical protein